MMCDLCLGIDLGTSGVRIAALAGDGVLIAAASEPMPAPEMRGDAIVQDPAIWWQATQAALGKLAAMLDVRRIGAIAVDGTSGTILPVGATGEPLTPASMYNDPSARGRVAGIEAVASRDTAALGGTSPLARALAMQSTPGIARILHQADWIAGKLSGRFDVSDESNALKTGYDPLERRWPDWIAATGLDPALLPEVVPAGTAIGEVGPQARRDFAFAPATRIVTGVTDGCAAFLATGASRPGDGVTSLGSTLTIKLLSDAPIFAPAFGIYSHRIGEMWLPGGASNSGGAVLLQHFGADRLAALESELRPDQPTGLDYYPLPQPGERFPVNDPALPPRLEPRPADDREFLQGMLEGIAAIEAQAYGKLAALGAPPLTSVRTVGGGAANAAWSSIRARALGVPMLPPRHREAAAGTARLAWRGLGHEV